MRLTKYTAFKYRMKLLKNNFELNKLYYYEFCFYSKSITILKNIGNTKNVPILKLTQNKNIQNTLTYFKIVTLNK